MVWQDTLVLWWCRVWKKLQAASQTVSLYFTSNIPLQWSQACICHLRDLSKFTEILQSHVAGLLLFMFAAVSSIWESLCFCTVWLNVGLSVHFWALNLPPHSKMYYTNSTIIIIIVVIIVTVNSSWFIKAASKNFTSWKE